MTDSNRKTVTHPIIIVTGGRRDGAVLLLGERGCDRRLGPAKLLEPLEQQ